MGLRPHWAKWLGAEILGNASLVQKLLVVHKASL